MMKNHSETPVVDFAWAYRDEGPVRMHMPGHKGIPFIGPEPLDLTEIDGADELYRARGIIRRSEETAAELFGAARTVYSAEGSSLCIRAMLYLARLTAAAEGKPLRLLAGRNAHRTLMTAAALLDLEIDWLMPSAEEGLLSCTVTEAGLEKALDARAYMAVFLTSPDYLGRRTDLRAAARVCAGHGVPLLVDNAHGAYLKFLEKDGHPLTLGADACCDSAHKTLGCLTGAAYLHLSRRAPSAWAEQAEQAMSLFASTSPSWLILQSLDRMNRELAGSAPDGIREAANRTAAIKEALRKEGWRWLGDEPMKLTADAAALGYDGRDLARLLREKQIVCEYADRDALVLMPSAATSEEDWSRLEAALKSVPVLQPLVCRRPALPVPERACSVRRAMLSPRETVSVGRAVGGVLADACVGCPPAVPPVIAGERITQAAAECLLYYGVEECQVLTENIII